MLTNAQRLLIVGGAGYVGSGITDLLSPTNDITVYDSIVYEKHFLKSVNFIRGDARDTAKLKKLLPNFDIVVWLAAVVGDGACAINPKLTYDINTEAVKWLVDNYDKKIVYPSTCSVYGINNELIDETAEPNPISVYASTKLEAEQYILKNANNPLVFRLGTLFGMGDNYARIRLDLVVNILAKRATLNEPLMVFGGEQWRPLLHVKDVAEAVKFGLQRTLVGLYNLASINLRIHEIAAEIKAVIPTATVEYRDIKFEDARNYRVNTDKILNTGWKPKYTLEYGIREINKVVAEGRIRDLNDPIYSNATYLGANGSWKTIQP